MSRPLAIILVGIAAVLIVFGRVNHRHPWGNRVALVGYAVLALAAVLTVLTRQAS